MPRPLSPDVMASTAGQQEAVRHHILEAAHRVITARGLAAASTRAIAAEAGIGAGTLYNYFEDRLELIAGAIRRRAQTHIASLAELPTLAGKGTIAGNLRQIVRQVGAILEELVPLFAAAFSDPELHDQLLHAHRGISPGSHEARLPAALPIARYLLAEREGGRLVPDADCRAAASLLISLCHDRAFQQFLHGGPPRSISREVDLIASALTVGTPAGRR
jgi:AcrR family transcriptional regulator